MCGLGGILYNPSGEAIEFFSACLSHEEVCALGGDVKKTIISKLSFWHSLSPFICGLVPWKAS